MKAAMDELVVRPYRGTDEAEVIRLWRDCGLLVSWNDPQEDIGRKVEFQPELFLVGELAGRPAATIMAGYEGHRGWINYLAVDPDRRRRGLGRRMMAAAEAELRKLGCLKINLQVRTSNTAVLDFYRALGFREEEVISLGKRLV